MSSDRNPRRIDHVWMTSPGSRAKAEHVLRQLLREVVEQDLEIPDAQLSGQTVEDVGGLMLLVRTCYQSQLGDLARSFLWVAGSMGDEGSRLELAREISAESQSDEPRRAPAYLNHLVVRWLNSSPVARAPEVKVERLRHLRNLAEARSDFLRAVDEPSTEVGSEDFSDDEQSDIPPEMLRRISEAEPSHIDALERALSRGAVVCKKIGDRNSKEGRDIHDRYGHIIGKRLSYSGSIDEPAVIAREMRDTFPWASDVARYIAGQLALLRNSAEDALKLPPLLLVGPPGSGKTRMLEWLCERLDASWQTISCGGIADSGGMGAVSRGWSSSRPSAPVQAMAEMECANPVLILDELEKGSEVGSRNGSVIATLISMMQNRGAFYDSCFLSTVDISRVSFVATANELSVLPPALCDRFVVFRVPRPSEEHFDSLITGVRRAEAARLGVHEEMLPWLSQGDTAWLRSAFASSGCSIRALEHAHRLILGERAAEEMEMAMRPN